MLHSDGNADGAEYADLHLLEDASGKWPTEGRGKQGGFGQGRHLLALQYRTPVETAVPLTKTDMSGCGALSRRARDDENITSEPVARVD